MIWALATSLSGLSTTTACTASPHCAQGMPITAQWGEAVHAVVVLKPDNEVASAQIIEHCRRQIAGYKTPKSVEFRAALPLSGAGKVLKRDLREPFWRGTDRGVS